MRLLEKAVAGLEGQADKQDLELFARYRLAILYAWNGQSESARRQLDWITNVNLYRSPEGDFLFDLVVREMAQERPRALELCAGGYALGRRDAPELQRFDGYLSETAATGAYPWTSEAWAPAVCPLDTFLTQALAAQTFGPGDPTDVLRQAGLVVDLVEPTQTPSGSGWLAVVHVDQPRLVLISPDGRAELVALTLDQVTGRLIALQADFTGDGVDETAIAYALEKGSVAACPDAQDAYAVVIGPDDTGRFVYSLACAPTGKRLDLPALLTDASGDGVSDWLAEVRATPTPFADDQAGEGPMWWAALPELIAIEPAAAESSLSSALGTIDQFFWTDPTGPRQRDLVEAAWRSIPPGALDGARVRQHLQFLEALSRERAGDRDGALALYLDLWRSQPQTLWTNLAASRIQGRP